MNYDHRRRILLMAVAAYLSVDDDNVALGALSKSLVDDVPVILSINTDNRKGIPGRSRKRSRNNPNWFYDYAISTEFLLSAFWSRMFQIPYTLFFKIGSEIWPTIERSNTQFRKALLAEIKLAAFLLYAGGSTCEKTACQLGIGTSSVSTIISEMSHCIALTYEQAIRFPVEEETVATAMKGFSDIRGLPYCVGAVDGTHIKWLSCPDEQFYEYRCYKGFPSIVIFAVATANRKFIYADVGRPGVLGDSTIYDRSSLKAHIENGLWLGNSIPDLVIADIPVRPYLIGDCAFTTSVNLMKTTSTREQAANPVLKYWDGIASQTRKPLECAFAMVKQRFLALKDGVRLHHENEIAKMCIACMILHNLSVHDGEFEDFVLPQDDVVEEDDPITAETSAGKKQRDALLYYAVNELGNNP